VRGLEGELAAAREDLAHRDEVARALEAALTAAASREGARAGGGAAALSKQVVAARVAEAEATRRLRRAAQTEADLRQVAAARARGAAAETFGSMHAQTSEFSSSVLPPAGP
jgi:hypothetical protein